MRKETIIQVFLSSPSNLDDERKIVGDSIQKANSSWAASSGLRIELLSWERNAWPSIGAYAQEVINSQIDDQYDIFVGILGSRFGSPTPNYGSGTEEEFEGALRRYQETRTPEIMFYFRTGKVDLSDISPKQLSSVLEFKERIQKLGCLTWDFTENQDFLEKFEVHLYKVVSNIIREPKEENKIREQSKIESGKNIQEDIGLIDALETFNEKMPRFTSMSGIMSNGMEKFSEKISQKTKEISKLHQLHSDYSMFTAKSIINDAANDMYAYCSEIEPMADEYEAHVKDIIAAAIRIPTVSQIDLGLENEDEYLRQVIDLRSTLFDVKDSLRGFQDSVGKTPRITKEIGKAREKLSRALDKYCQVIEDGYKALDTTIRDLESKRHPLNSPI